MFAATVLIYSYFTFPRSSFWAVHSRPCESSIYLQCIGAIYTNLAATEFLHVKSSGHTSALQYILRVNRCFIFLGGGAAMCRWLLDVCYCLVVLGVLVIWQFLHEYD